MKSYLCKVVIDFFLSIALEDIRKRQKKKPNPTFKSLIFTFLELNSSLFIYKTSKRSTTSKFDQNSRLYSTNSKLPLIRFPNLTWEIKQAGTSWFQPFSTMLMIFSCWINRIEMFVISATVGNSGRASTSTRTALCPSHGCV